MKQIAFLLILFTIFLSLGQKDTIIEIHKFKNGKTATIVVLKDQREGYAKAYNFQGKEIYHNYIRRYAGNASVTFTHHANGMVKEAHYSSHPDAGIQWYNTWTTFDEQGNKTGERQSNWDDRTTIPIHYLRDTTNKPYVTPKRPQVIPPNKTEPIQQPSKSKQETIACAPIHKNSTFFVNHSKRRIILNINHAGKDTLVLLKSKASYPGPVYISAQISSPMNQNVRFTYNSTNKKFVIDAVAESFPSGTLETIHKVHFYARRK
jgi:hypothetical protein